MKHKFWFGCDDHVAGNPSVATAGRYKQQLLAIRPAADNSLCVFYSVFIVIVQLTSNGFVLCMFINCKIMKFRHVKYDAILFFYTLTTIRQVNLAKLGV